MVLTDHRKVAENFGNFIEANVLEIFWDNVVFLV